MKKGRDRIDRAAGRLYTRIVAIIAGTVSIVMLIAALLAWRGSASGASVIWITGAIVFGVIARASWRSRAGLGDIDFTG